MEKKILWPNEQVIIGDVEEVATVSRTLLISVNQRAIQAPGAEGTAKSKV